MRFATLLLVTVMLLLAGCGGSDASPPEEAPTPVQAASAADTAWTPDATTRRLFQEVMAYARAHDLHERPLGEVMQALGLRFRGQPYVAGMLDAPATEKLICRLDGFDCVTFVETALALARTVRAQEDRFAAFMRHVQEGRYRGGAMDGYCSRLHYFSEWIADNERRGHVRNITEALGGEPLDKTLDFMSTHREAYPRFATNDSLYRCIGQMEARLADMELHYIPQDRIHAVYDRLEAGDIVALATSIDGLDVSHTGLVYKGPDGATGLLHASTSDGVTVSPDLQSYVQHVDVQIGIVVARPLPHR